MYDQTGKRPVDDVIKEYAPLVRRIGLMIIAKMPASVLLDDLIQAGLIGLLDAATRYDAREGATFETYANSRIRGAMIDELRGTDWLSRGMRKTAREVEKAIQMLEQSLYRAPTEAEVAKQLDMPLPEYQALLYDLHGSQIIYYEDFESSEDEPFLDAVHCDRRDPLELLADSNLRDAVIEAIEALPGREKLLMSLYYERNMNLKEIGAALDVSESRACQLHSQAVMRVRTHLREGTWIQVEKPRKTGTRG